MPSPVTSDQPAADATVGKRAAPVPGIGIEHTVATAHRPPRLPGTGTSLHGHCRPATNGVTAAGLGEDATVVEYGAAAAQVSRVILRETHRNTAISARYPPLRLEAAMREATLTDPVTDRAAGCLGWHR